MLTPGNRSLKAQLKVANRVNAAFAIIVGEEEVEAKQVTIRNMQNGQQVNIDLAAVGQWLMERL
jgi:histidyl-tRNA synthetase